MIKYKLKHYNFSKKAISWRKSRRLYIGWNIGYISSISWASNHIKFISKCWASNSNRLWKYEF